MSGELEGDHLKEPRDSQRSKLYKAEDGASKGEQFETVAECQAYVDHITASAWWCTYQVPWIDIDPPTRSSIRGVGPGDRSPAQRLGWGGKGKIPLRTKGIVPTRRDELKPVVEVRDGRGALAWANIIMLPKWARNERVILHELAHVIATERPAHGRQFARIFIDLLQRFHPQRHAAAAALKVAFAEKKVRWKRKRKTSADNPGIRKFREIAAARRAGKDES